MDVSTTKTLERRFSWSELSNLKDIATSERFQWRITARWVSETINNGLAILVFTD